MVVVDFVVVDAVVVTICGVSWIVVAQQGLRHHGFY
jgi:hypothetical protein